MLRLCLTNELFYWKRSSYMTLESKMLQFTVGTIQGERYYFTLLSTSFSPPPAVDVFSGRRVSQFFFSS